MILVVDDELPNVLLLEKILRREGYQNVSVTTDSRRAIQMFEDDRPDLILLDLHMPHQNGYEVMTALAPLQDPQLPVPIIVLTADATPEAKHRAFKEGATDFLSKPFDNVEVALRIKNALQTRFLQRKLENQNKVLDERVRQRTTVLQTTLSDLRLVQQQVVQQERLHALGMMTTGIAHDFNNLLSLILGYAELLFNQVPPEESESKETKYLQTLIGAARDGASMVNRLAQFQRPASTSDPQERVDLERLVRQAIDLTMPKWKQQASASGIDIEIIADLAPDVHVIGNPGELRDLFTNLIFNAVDAMPAGGRIFVRTRLGNEMGIIEVKDTGTGMSEEVRRRCLEPFFTTKGTKGSGLGLAMIYGIVQRHGGTLDIRTALDQGTAFQIQLPLGGHAGEVEKVFPDWISEPLRILVVDDQPILREVLAEQLQTDCHRVTAAADGAAAIAEFRRNQFDLVITDQAMPGMSGEQLAAALREVRPDTLIMLLTGFAESGISAPLSPAIDLVLGKPTSLTTLRQAIARLCTARDGDPATTPLKSETETEMKGPEVLARARAGVDAVIEPHRPDR